MRRWMRGSLVALAVVTAMAAGCAGTKGAGSGSSAPERRDVTMGAPQQALDRRAETTMDAIADRGSLQFVVGSTHFPAGFADKITRTMFTEKVKRNLVFQGASFEPLRTGEADVVIASWPPEEDRTMYHASPPIYTDSIRLMVPAGTKITTVADLQGKAVGYVRGDSLSSAERLRRYLDSKKQSVDIRFEEFDQFIVAADEMVRGKVSAVVGPASQLQPIVKGGYGMAALVPEQYYTWTYNVYVLKQNVGVAAAVDKAVRQMTDSGELNRLLEEYDMRM
jgi:ABC-type amino acid transport substrate-binding protein